MILYLQHVSFGNITAPSLSIFLSTGARLCRKAKLNKNLHLALKLQWERWGEKVYFSRLVPYSGGPLWSKASFYSVWTWCWINRSLDLFKRKRRLEKEMFD